MGFGSCWEASLHLGEVQVGLQVDRQVGHQVTPGPPRQPALSPPAAPSLSKFWPESKEQLALPFSILLSLC